MTFPFHRLPELLSAAVACYANWKLWCWFGLRPLWRLPVMVWAGGSFLFTIPRIARQIPYNDTFEWWRAMGTAWAVATTGAFLLIWLLRWFQAPAATDPSRRKLLRLATGAAFAVPAAVTGYGVFINRHRFQLNAVDIPVRNLPKPLEGLRLVQLTDIHMSPLLGPREVERAVDMANETRAHIALVTGDMITMRRDPIDDCLRILAGLRAEAGVYGCLGNHEIYAGCQDYATAQAARFGIRFLRGASAEIRFGGALLNLAGVDYQPRQLPYLLGAEKLLHPQAVNVLLSHNPDVFPVAARLGYDLTVSGHTHGGQVTVEILNQYANVTRFYTRYVSGLYLDAGASIHVSRGLGTIGPPLRLGAPPEVTLLRLCAG
ncbi:MAG: metallophosphoesterase [Acidimicrobiia bacterium]|nr:metallophosphoesterase [Acidimicrobiia bacterium]